MLLETGTDEKRILEQIQGVARKPNGPAIRQLTVVPVASVAYTTSGRPICIQHRILRCAEAAAETEILVSAARKPLFFTRKSRHGEVLRRGSSSVSSTRGQFRSARPGLGISRFGCHAVPRVKFHCRLLFHHALLHYAPFDANSDRKSVV